MPPDLKLDPQTWDLDLSGSTLNLTDDASGDTATQAVGIRLKLILGEWFLDTRIGMDYFGTVFVKNPNLAAIEAMIQAAILDTPSIARIVNFSQVFDRTARQLTVTCTLLDDEGNTLNLQATAP
ncbi:MAG: hypothetical protein KGR26_10455 [Cyanobacteria bacterium REEB65]|nr:hypothetical protein [Cyanobacteria bacterium REEB65]